MALQAIPGGFFLPSIFISIGPPNVSGTQLLFDAAGERSAFIFQAPETGTINTVEFLTGTVSINAASVVRVSLQDVSLTTGDPDGAQDQFRDVLGSAITSTTWIQPGLLTDDGTNGGNKRTVNRGDLLSLVIEFQSFTAGDSVNILGANNPSTTTQNQSYQYGDSFSASWAKQSPNPILAIQYSDGLYKAVGGKILPSKAINTQNFNSSSNPDERGLKFSVPVPCTIKGASVNLAISGAGGASLVLYDTDGSTVLRSVSLDADVKNTTAGRSYIIPFDDVTLTPNVSYRLTILPSSTTNLSVYDFDVQSTAHMNAVDCGANWIQTQRTDGGAWTDTNTKRPYMALWVSAIDDGVPRLAAGLHPITSGITA